MVTKWWISVCPGLGGPESVHRVHTFFGPSLRVCLTAIRLAWPIIDPVIRVLEASMIENKQLEDKKPDGSYSI